MYAMNRYKGNCSIADTISENPQGNKWQMAVEDISESNEADGMYEEEGKSCVYTYTEIIVRNKNCQCNVYMQDKYSLQKCIINIHLAWNKAVEQHRLKMKLRTITTM